MNLTAQLSAQSRKLNEFGTRSDQGETAVHRVMLHLTAHLDLSDDFAREQERIAATLEAHAHQLQLLLQDQQRLERSFAPMRVLHSFFRIESAALPVEQQALFHAVTTEMRRLHDEVSVSFAADGAALADTRRRVLAAASHLHAQSAQHLATTAAKRAEVQRSLAHLTVTLERTRQRNQQLASAITALDRETDQITVSLQYQDITRQKMEHVREAADKVLAGFTPADRTPFRQRARVQQMLCQVQGVQLTAVRQELERATGSITAGLRTLLEQLDCIERDCLSVAGLNEITVEMDAAIAGVGEIHRVTAELMQSALGRLAEAIQTARGFAEAATGATGTMRRIAADLLLMGINAQVQALQAKNACLEVLSSAVSHISSEAGTLTLGFEHKLEATTETLAGFIRQSESFHEKIQAEHHAQAVRDEANFSELQSEHEAHKTLVTEVGAALQQLKRQADDLLASIDLADISRDPIERLSELFAALGTLCADAAGKDLPLDDDALADVHGRYTMASERVAHATALAPSRGVAAAALLSTEPEPAKANSDAALGDNVELF